MDAHMAGLAKHKCQPAFDISRCRNQRRVHVQACRISTISGDRCPLSRPVWHSPPMSGGISSSRSRRIMRPVQCKADRALQPARVAKLRELLSGPNILKGACCHDGLSARLIEDAGFPFAFMSGFCVAAARLGAPDAGLLSYGEVLDQGRCVNEATRQLPIIGDGDTGYGNAVNVQRTVRGFAAAGFAGILIEDQVAAKSCGHVRGKEVVSRAEAVSRIRAAVEVRDSGADIVIIARSDARQAVSLDEALWRAQAFAEAGADVIFIDALESVDELRAFCQLGGAATSVPKMANNLEGGKSPQLRPEVLQDLGFKLVAYPLSLLGVSVRAMQVALQGLAQGKPPPPSAMPSFQELQAVVGFPDYFETAEKYALPATAAKPPHSTAPLPASPHPSSADFKPEAESDPSPSSSRQPSQSPERAAVSGDLTDSRGGAASVDEAGSRPVVEADTIIAGDGTQRRGVGDADTSDAFNRDATVPEIPEFALSEQWRSADRRALCLRIKVSGATDGAVKLETRAPAGFLSGLAAFIPQVAGLNLDERLTQAQGESSFESGDPLVDFISGLDRIEVFIESANGAW